MTGALTIVPEPSTFALAALGLLTPSASAGDPEHDWGVWVAFASQGHLSPGDPDARWRAWLGVLAKVFRTGLLMYGKRPGLKDLARAFRQA